MAIPGIQEIQSLATKYSKPQLQKMAQMGLIDPTKAVMAGMMIDRIQKQNMQPPQQTVADEVMGAPQMPQMAQAAGIAGLPSNLPPQMAGGGIVAFADGGDIDDYADGGVVGYADGNLVQGDPGIIKYVDPNWADPKRFKRDYTPDDKFAILAEQLARLTAAERQAEGLDKVRIQKDIAELQSTMRGLRAGPAARSLVDQIPLPSAAAAEPTRAAPSKSKTSSLPDEPVYTPEGVLLYGETPTEPAVRRTPPGQTYEPSLIRDILEGRPNVQIAPPKKEPKPEAAPAPAPAPAPKAAEKEAPKEKAEMGPARPSAEQRLESQLAGLSGKAGKELTPDEVISEQDRMFERLGVNKDFFTNLRKDYESTRGKFQDRADKAAGHALMMFGAGLMGARRGEEFATASKAAQQSLMMYMSSMDKITDQEEKLNKDLRDLAISEENYKRTRATSALEAVQKNREKVADRQVQITELENRGLVALTNAAVERFKAENPAEYVKYKKIAEETGKPIEEVIKMFNMQRSGEISRTTAFKEYNDLIANPLSREEIKRLYPGGFDDYFRALQGGAGGSGGGAPLAIGQVVDGYKYKGGDPNSQGSWEKVK